MVEAVFLQALLLFGQLPSARRFRDILTSVTPHSLYQDLRRDDGFVGNRASPEQKLEGQMQGFDCQGLVYKPHVTLRVQLPRLQPSSKTGSCDHQCPLA